MPHTWGRVEKTGPPPLQRQDLPVLTPLVIGLIILVILGLIVVVDYLSSKAQERRLNETGRRHNVPDPTLDTATNQSIIMANANQIRNSTFGI